MKDTELANSYTISDYEKDLKEGNSKRIATKLMSRFNERYFHPLMKMDARNKHGFLTMSVACLVIDSFMRFTGKVDAVKADGEYIYLTFFRSYPVFKFDDELAKSFYHYVRCGLLHDAETRRNWRIQRRGNTFDKEKMVINATKFLRETQKIIEEFTNNLNGKDLNDPAWTPVKAKFNLIIEKCHKDWTHQTKGKK